MMRMMTSSVSIPKFFVSRSSRRSLEFSSPPATPRPRRQTASSSALQTTRAKSKISCAWGRTAENQLPRLPMSSTKSFSRRAGNFQRLELRFKPALAPSRTFNRFTLVSDAVSQKISFASSSGFCARAKR